MTDLDQVFENCYYDHKLVYKMQFVVLDQIKTWRVCEACSNKLCHRGYCKKENLR